MRVLALLAALAVACSSPAPAQYGMRGGSQGGGSPPDTTWPNDPYLQNVANWVLISDYGADSADHATPTWNTGCGTGCTNGNGSTFTVDSTTSSGSSGKRSPPRAWRWFYKSGDGSVCGSSTGVPTTTFSAKSAIYWGAWVRYSSGYSFPANPETHIVSIFDTHSPQGSAVVDLGGGATVVVNELAQVAGGNWNSSQQFGTGSWRKVEVLIDLSAQHASMWIDGVKTMDTLNFTTNGAVAFNQANMANDWGGCGSPPLAPVNDDSTWVDHVHLTGRP